jgi:hypothetical protein
MLSSIEYQGYTIKAPKGPSGQGEFTSNPTEVQIISQVDQMLVFTDPPTFDSVMSGRGADNELVPGTVTFRCWWKQLWSTVAQDSDVQMAVNYTVGVTTTDSDTTTFGMTFGVEGAGLAGLSAALSASFSQSTTHSVALAESRSVTQSFTAKPGTTLQVWQLHSEYIAEFDKDGKSYRYVLSTAGSLQDGVILALTFPESEAAAA